MNLFQVLLAPKTARASSEPRTTTTIKQSSTIRLRKDTLR